MFTKVIVWSLPNGQFAKTTPNLHPLDGETEEDYLDRIEALTRAKTPDQDGNLVSAIGDDWVREGEANISEFPAPPLHRAWIFKNGKIFHDVEKAKNITKERLRRERLPLLEQQDIEFMLAIESGDEAVKSIIVSEKQRLRNVTTLVDKVTGSTKEVFKKLNALSVFKNVVT